MYCWKCGRLIPDDAVNCPYCNVFVGFRGSAPLLGSISGALTTGSWLSWPDDKEMANTAAATASTVATFDAYYSSARSAIDTMRKFGIDDQLLRPVENNIEKMREEGDQLKRKLDESMRKGREEVINVYREANIKIEEFNKFQRQNFLAIEVVNLVRKCNMLFHTVTSVPHLFRESMEIASELQKPCITEENFRLKLGALAQLFEVELQPLRSLLRNFDPQWKSVKLIEAWLQQRAIQYDPLILEVWSKVIDFRNASFPYHPSDSRIVELVRFFGHDFPVDFLELWMSILEKFSNSLIKFQDLLSQIR